METIDRSSPLPFYVQLERILRAEFTRQGLVPGDRVLSDHELCDRYDVSRSVVRQALSILETDGVITRTRGKGTFVAYPKVDQGLVRSTRGLYEDARERGQAIVSQVRRQDVVAADEPVAERLGLKVGAPVVTVERLRSLDGEPWVHTTTWLPHDVVPGLEDADLEHRSLYETLRQDYGLQFGRAHRSVEAALAGEPTGTLLGIGADAPVLVLRSVLYDVDGRAIETFVAHHRGDRSRFDVSIGGQGGALVVPLE